MNKTGSKRPQKDTSLALENTAQLRARGLRPKERTSRGGYNPYDTVPAVRDPKAGQKTGRKTDLRKLSQWIRIQRQVDAIKKEDDDASGG